MKLLSKFKTQDFIQSIFNIFGILDIREDKLSDYRKNLGFEIRLTKVRKASDQYYGNSGNGMDRYYNENPGRKKDSWNLPDTKTGTGVGYKHELTKRPKDDYYDNQYDNNRRRSNSKKKYSGSNRQYYNNDDGLDYELADAPENKEKGRNASRSKSQKNQSKYNYGGNKFEYIGKEENWEDSEEEVVEGDDDIDGNSEEFQSAPKQRGRNRVGSGNVKGKSNRGKDSKDGVYYVKKDDDEDSEYIQKPVV